MKAIQKVPKWIPPGFQLVGHCSNPDIVCVNMEHPTCPVCGLGLNPDRQFCHGCGWEVEEQVFLAFRHLNPIAPAYLQAVCGHFLPHTVRVLSYFPTKKNHSVVLDIATGAFQMPETLADKLLLLERVTLSLLAHRKAGIDLSLKLLGFDTNHRCIWSLGDTSDNETLHQIASCLLDQVHPAHMPAAFRAWFFQSESSPEVLLAVLNGMGSPRQLHWQVQTGSHIGKYSSEQQDAVSSFGVQLKGRFKDNTWQVVTVADGIGSTPHADQAAALAAKSGFFCLQPLLERDSEPLTVLQNNLQSLNQRILKHARRHPECEGMGCTVVQLAAASDGEIFIAHAGDSRAYLISPAIAQIWPLTQDHTFENFHEHLSAEQELQAGTLISSLGVPPDALYLDLNQAQVATGEYILICTDGLYRMVPEATLLRLVSRHGLQAVPHLIQAALQGGGLDNIGLALLQPEEVRHVDSLVA